MTGVTTFTHGKHAVTEFRVTGDPDWIDISEYVTESSLPKNRAEHDTTTYGPTDDSTFQGGLRDRTHELKGKWNPTIGAILEDLDAADSIDLRWSPAGNGTGMPNYTAAGFVTKYDDPSTVSDIGEWSMSIRVSGPVDKDVYA